MVAFRVLAGVLVAIEALVFFIPFPEDVTNGDRVICSTILLACILVCLGIDLVLGGLERIADTKIESTSKSAKR